MVHRGEGGDTTALTFTAIEELFVVIGLETNVEPQRLEVGAKFHPQRGSLSWRRKTEKAEEGEVLLLLGKSYQSMGSYLPCAVTHTYKHQEFTPPQS